MYFWHRLLRHHKKKAGVEKKAGSSDLKWKEGKVRLVSDLLTADSQSSRQEKAKKQSIFYLKLSDWLGRWCFEFIEKSIHAIILWPPPMILVTMSYNNSMMVISMLTLHYHQRCADGHLDPRRRDRAWDCSCRPEDLCCCWGAMIMMI